MIGDIVTTDEGMVLKQMQEAEEDDDGYRVICLYPSDDLNNLMFKAYAYESAATTLANSGKLKQSVK